MENIKNIKYFNKVFMIFGFLFCFTIEIQALRVLKLGFITPNSGPLSFGTTAAATTMAVEKAKKDGYLVNTDVK